MGEGTLPNSTLLTPRSPARNVAPNRTDQLQLLPVISELFMGVVMGVGSAVVVVFVVTKRIGAVSNRMEEIRTCELSWCWWRRFLRRNSSVISPARSRFKIPPGSRRFLEANVPGPREARAEQPQTTDGRYYQIGFLLCLPVVSVAHKYLEF